MKNFPPPEKILYATLESRHEGHNNIIETVNMMVKWACVARMIYRGAVYIYIMEINIHSKEVTLAK